MPADNSCVTLPGPWTHRRIQAHGAQFHIAEAGDPEGKLVLLLHGFPQYWWAWRNQIEPLAEAGYYVVAVDQRGIGGSDKTPDAHDSLTLSEDILAIIRSLGASSAVLVGMGRGGSLAWSATSMEPELVEALVVVSAPHPRTTYRIGTHLTLKTWRHAFSTLFPFISRGGLKSRRTVENMLLDWSAPGNTGASSQADVYSQALNLPGAASVAFDQLRWTWLSQRTPSGRDYLRRSANPIEAPVLSIRGHLDPLIPDRAFNKDREFAVGPYQHVEVPESGHFVPEERPEVFTSILLDFLKKL